MSDLAIIIIGFLIFFTYMFFLLRMIYRQHNSQKQAGVKVLQFKSEEDDKIAS